jgi:hypothetical protein
LGIIHQKCQKGKKYTSTQETKIGFGFLKEEKNKEKRSFIIEEFLKNPLSSMIFTLSGGER